MRNKERKRELEQILKSYSPEKANLIPILQEIQKNFGYLSRPVVREISEYLGISESKVYGIATFYTQFRFEPLGKHQIKICHGTACHVKGSEGITETIENYLGIRIGKTSEDGVFTLERVACLGCCSLAPVMMIDGEVYGNLTRERVEEVLENIGGEQ